MVVNLYCKLLLIIVAIEAQDSDQEQKVTAKEGVVNGSDMFGGN